jgi:hypothetical protein
VAIFEEEACVKEGDFSPGHAKNSDEFSDEEPQTSEKFHRASATADKRGPSL